MTAWVDGGVGREAGVRGEGGWGERWRGVCRAAAEAGGGGQLGKGAG